MLEGCNSMKKNTFYKYNNNLLNIKKIFGNSQKKYITFSKNKILIFYIIKLIINIKQLK